MTDPLLKRIYYSQNREDLILEAFFWDTTKGFYVDVGANDPLVDSVTKLFYEKGWKGINIEPIKRHYDALKSQRPRDLNLNMGIGKAEDTLTFYEYTSGDGLSTFSSEMVKEYEKLDDEIHQDTKQYKVKIKTLRNVFKENKVQKIHFMKVDVEGLEYDVLAGNDWTKFRPEVICIEANHIVKDWRPILKKNDYELVFFDGLNEYYADSHTSRKEKFDYVNHVVIDKGGGVRLADYDTIKRNEEAIRIAHLRLQEALRANAHQTELYQQLLAENHSNHTRAVVAERALRRPLPFLKYELKGAHHLTVKKLSAKPDPEYIKEERGSIKQALGELKKAKNNEQLLEGAKKIAHIETSRLERIFRAGQHQPASLKIYMRFVGGLKRLKMKGAAK